MTPLFETMKDVLNLGFFEKLLSILPIGLILELDTNHQPFNLFFLIIWLIVSILSLIFTYHYKFQKR